MSRIAFALREARADRVTALQMLDRWLRVESGGPNTDRWVLVAYGWDDVCRVLAAALIGGGL